MWIVAVVGVNAVTLLYFWLDKIRAQAGEWRVPESNLLFLALIGGSPAAFFGRRVLRHKTRKEPFSTQLQLIAAIQVGALVGFALFDWI